MSLHPRRCRRAAPLELRRAARRGFSRFPELLETRSLLTAAALALEDVVVVESDADQNDVAFRLLRSGDLSTAVTVEYQTLAGTAQAGSDFLATAGSVTIPPGSSEVQITVPIRGDLLPEPTETFSLQLTGVSAVVGSEPSFAARQNFAAGDHPLVIAAADINGDGRPDLVAANRDSATVSVLLSTTAAGSETASFAPAVSFNVGVLPSGLAIGDINRDGRPDLAVSHFATPEVAVLLNTTASLAATPSFAPLRNVALPGLAAGLTLGDLTGDGAPELVVTDGAANLARVFLNDTAVGAAAPAFTAGPTAAVGLFPHDVKVVDFNDDGGPDLVVGNQQGNSVSVVLNNTAAGAPGLTFVSKVDFPTGPFPISVASGDINGDGRPDIVTGNFGSAPARGNTVSVLLNTMPAGSLSASFAEQQEFVTAESPYAVVVAELTGDGVPDVATANNGFGAAVGESASVLRNTTPAGSAVASFAPPHVDLPTGQNPSGIAAADLNGDGRLDLAVAVQPEDNLAVLLNTQARIDDGAAVGTILDNDVVAVLGRHVFYNNSKFDDRQPQADALDDGAIAPDKQALRPGGAASFANYTSFTGGLNGLMVDIAGLPAAPSAADFELRVGNNNAVGAWAAAPAPASVTVRPGAGVGGSDRVTLIWADGAVKKQWLRVAVLPTAATGLAEADVFYFGNAVGESGNSTTDAVVNASDEIGARSNPRNPLNPAPIDFRWDYNRDGLVDATDQIRARTNSTNPLVALKLIAPASEAGEGSLAALAAAADDAAAQAGSRWRRKR